MLLRSETSVENWPYSYWHADMLLRFHTAWFLVLLMFSTDILHLTAHYYKSLIIDDILF
jgi:hypothetical protein